MSVPHFDFTARAVPVVQMGRAEHRQLGNDTWGTARWGVAKWGAKDWEPVWADLTCEVHEVTTNTGRGGATDRFVPGTAEIVASNMNQVSELIFPPVPDTGEGFEYVEQPPITNEEDLQAPAAATVTSTGWDFTDDFERTGPKWVFPAAWSTTGLAPTVMFRHVEDGFEPEMHADPTVADMYEANGAARWTQRYDGDAEIYIELENLDWPSEPTSGSPEVVVELYVRMNQTDKECICGRVRFVPVFGGPNEIHHRLLHMGADGSEIAGAGSHPDFPTITGTGSNGVFGPRWLRLTVLGADPPNVLLQIQGVSIGGSWFADEDVAGDRIGLAVSYVEGQLTDSKGAPRVVLISGEDFVDDMTRPLGSGWQLPAAYSRAGYNPMHAEAGSMLGTQFFIDAYNGRYARDGIAYWKSEFAGDQYVEVQLGQMAKPWQTNTFSVRLYAHGNPTDRAAMVAEIEYDPSPDGDNYLYALLYQNGPNEEYIDYAPASYTEVNLGEIGGAFGDDRWRYESDVAGTQRLYRNGVLFVEATAPNQEIGGRIGVYMSDDFNDSEEVGHTPGVTPPGGRIDRFSGGLRSVLGTEELGMWVRIGVDHATLGNHWFFRGFVDAVVPTYHPEHSDVCRIECVDSLGEAGRVFVDGGMLPHRFAEAGTRIRQILNAAHWPDGKRQIRDDATSLSRPPAGRAVDLLTQAAESCGGAVYGDPDSGDIVFKGQDWQGVHASKDPLAFITNYRPDFVVDDLPRVCPVEWERSSRRSEMLTRVRYSSETSDTEDGLPIVKEWRGPGAERMYGVELYERTLLCISGERLNELAIRQLRLRHPNQFPRVEAVVLDAATADEALDLMTTATFTRPSKYWCQLERDGEFVFNRKYLVTGVRHRMTPGRWQCRLALDPSSVFYETGGRWGKARWGRHDQGSDVWGNTR